MPLLEIEALRFLDRGPYDLVLESGQCLGLAGPSGVGKSLLLKSVADLFPHQGEIRLEQEACSLCEAPAWRRRVGLLPAESRWWHARAGDHFSEPPTQLAELGLREEHLKQPIRQLSSGEKQRLALLRLLQQGPRVLLLDEPTANLDRDNVTGWERFLAQYRQQHDAAVIWVSHDRSQLNRVADRILELHLDGLREEGA